LNIISNYCNKAYINAIHITRLSTTYILYDGRVL